MPEPFADSYFAYKVCDNGLKKKEDTNIMPFLAHLRLSLQKATRVRNYVTMTPTKPLVLFFSPVRHALSTYEQLQQVAQTEVVTSQSREEFFHDLTTKYKNVFAIYRTSASGSVRVLCLFACQLTVLTSI